MSAVLLIISFRDEEQLVYPTLEELEERSRENPHINAIGGRNAEIVDVFPSQEAAEEWVKAAQRVASPDYFGRGCFATVPVSTFTTETEVVNH